ncbi:MAG: hypothetical protein KF767_04085 [Bdellovibrionaceae bacterium]|nr:hypothetical protein [Pseudobdellovibrionaceae bacterium]
MMKLMAGLMLSLVTATAAQAAGPIGVGLILGTPVGVTGNYKLDEGHSIDLALAWRFYPGTETYLHSTYLWRFPDYYRVEEFPMLFYAGVGGRLYSTTRETNKPDTGRTYLGVRTSVGTSYTLPKAPVEFFGELALTLDLTPSTAASIGAGLGGRFYF